MQRLPFLLALAGLLVAAPAAACTTSWVNPGGGVWSAPANWSAGVPDAADDACVVLDGTYTVVLDIDAAVHALTLGGGAGTQALVLGPGRTLAVSAPSHVGARGVLDWTGGTVLTGAGGLTNDGILRLTGEGEKRLGLGGAATLHNHGTVAWSAGALRFGEDTVVENHGLFDIQGDLPFNLPLAPYGVIRNRSTGVLRKSAGPSLLFAFVPVENEGVVESLSGSLQLAAGSTHTDARLEAAAGAELLLYIGPHVISGTLSGSPDGTVATTGDLAAAPGGATLDFSGTGFEWGNGRIYGGQPLANAGLLRLTGDGQKQLRDGATLTNAGTVAWEGGSLLIANGSSFVNAGVVEVRSSGDVLPALLGAGFVNAAGGVYRRAEGTGNHIIDLVFQNAGTLEALSGAIYLRGGSTHLDATVEAAAGASVWFGGGTHTVVGTLSGSPAGRVVLSAAGVVAAEPGGTLALGGTGFEWEGGTLGGSAPVTNAGLLRITGPFAAKRIADATTLVNTGTVVWEGGALDLGSGAAVENAGLFDVRADLLMQGAAAGGRFVNADGGLFRKSAGTSAAIVDALVDVVNEAGGVISAESGTLAFFGRFDHQAGALVRGTASFANGGAVTHEGDTAPGPGIAALNWYSGYAPTAASTLFIELGPLDHDRLETGNAAALDGTLHLDFPGLYAPRVGDAFSVLFAPNGVAGTFAAVEAPVGFTFDVTYGPDAVTVTVADEPGVIVSAAAEHTPFVIPPEGGDLRLVVRLTNTTGQAQTGDVWAEGVLPGGAVVPVGRRALELPAGATVTRYLRLYVPGNAPAGAYTMRLSGGTYPDGVISADDFTFEKAAPTLAVAPVAWRAEETGEDAYALVAEDAEAAPEASSELPAAFALHAAYPNPFADRATLRYDLPEAGPVRLVVYDLLGREVVVLVDGEREAGRHTTILDGHALAPGVYVVRMIAGARALTQRVTLAR